MTGTEDKAEDEDEDEDEACREESCSGEGWGWMGRETATVVVAAGAMDCLRHSTAAQGAAEASQMTLPLPLLGPTLKPVEMTFPRPLGLAGGGHREEGGG